MTIHVLKVWPEFYRELASGNKTFEIRKDDRGLQTGDILKLWEFDPNTSKYSGRYLTRRIGYILTGPAFGLEDGYVCLSLKDTF